MSLTGISAYAPVIRITIDHHGVFQKGKIYSFQQIKGVGPRLDKQGDVARQIKLLSEEDFPHNEACIDNKGNITLR